MKELESIKKIVSEHGYEKTARMIGVSWRTVKRWCDGDNKPSDLAIEAIRKMLSILTEDVNDKSAGNGR